VVAGFPSENVTTQEGERGRAVDLPAVIAGYWILLLGLGTGGAWLAVSGRRFRTGVLLFVCSCVVAVATIFEPEIDERLVARATAHAPPPSALVIRTASPDAERIAAAFARTGFELYLASAEGWLTTASRVTLEQSDECDAPAPSQAPCLHRVDKVPLPPCRAEIKFDGPADSGEALARSAQVLVIREAGVPCPFYGPHRELPLSIQQTRRLLPYFTYFGRAASAVPSMRVIGIVASPTRNSLLRSLGVDPPSRL
jgi:hypothetical protein